MLTQAASQKQPRLLMAVQLLEDPSICCLQETHFMAKDTHTLKVRGWEKIFHAKGNQKKAGE